MNIQIKVVLVAFSIMAMSAMSCSKIENRTKEEADLVVYGNIYTSEKDCLHAEAFAVKDGKYIYVGDRNHARRYVGNATNVIEHPDGMIMAGCTEGHGHYITESIFKQLCYLKSESFEGCLDEIRDYYAAHKDIKQFWGYGWYEWNFSEEELESFRTELDKIIPDIPAFICDREMHQGWVNTKCLQAAGIDDATTVLEGGTIYRKDGVPTGRIQDQACGYVRLKALEPLADVNTYSKAVMDAQSNLLSMGYTNYLDAWLSYDNSPNAYSALQSVDNDGDLTLNVVGCYEIDSYKIKTSEDYMRETATAVDWKGRYSSAHFAPNTIKLFADGCTESFQGYVYDAYPATGEHGTKNWDNDLLNQTVAYMNSKDMLVHIHSYGDAAATMVVDAFAYSADKNGKHFRNGIGHAASVIPADMDRIAKYGIGVAENFCWHNLVAAEDDVEGVGPALFYGMYPMKSFFDHGVPVSSSTDAPCSVGYPADPFGIMENMLTGINPLSPEEPRTPSECTDIDQAIASLTINGAWQLGLEDERGSISKGKYADFLIIDRDITKVEKTDVHNNVIEAVYFEGQKVK